MKRCSRCGDERPSDQFYGRSDGSLNPWCKPCYRAWYVARNGGLTLRPCSGCRTDMEVTFRRAAEESVFCSRPCKERHRRQALQASINAAKPPRRCLHCNGPIAKERRADARFCSERCNSAAHALIRKLAARGGTERRRHYIRAAIGTRDKWVCGICLGKVDYRLRYPDPGVASLDHVVPLSRGGTHDWSNLRITHLSCNVRRRAAA